MSFAQLLLTKGDNVTIVIHPVDMKYYDVRLGLYLFNIDI